MTKLTLQKRATQISVAAFFAASGLMLTGFALYSMTKRELSKREVQHELLRTAPSQIEELIPSYLLPEQSAGVDLLLSRFIRNETLTRALVIQSANDIPKEFQSCKLSQLQPTTCLTREGRETAVIVPISESGKVFGYLFKSTRNLETLAIQDILKLVGTFALMLLVAFGMIYLCLAWLLSRTLPRALGRLVNWVEMDLNGNKSDIPPLPFKELEVLRERISEVMARHNHTRDQAVIGQLTSGIMHDIRTPLQSVVTALHLLEKCPPESLKRISRLENLASMCMINLPIVGNIIETTLDGSRKIQLQTRPENVVATIRDGIMLNQNLCLLRKGEVQIKAPDSVIVSHDPTQLMRVIHNLVKNGIEADRSAPNTPAVVVTVENPNPTEILISVEDNGTGISGSPNRVFRAFQSSKIRGTGLGLHVSRRIIEAHKGCIRASNRSSLGGARFEVILPIEPSGISGGIA